MNSMASLAGRAWKDCPHFEKAFPKTRWRRMVVLSMLGLVLIVGTFLFNVGFYLRQARISVMTYRHALAHPLPDHRVYSTAERIPLASANATRFCTNAEYQQIHNLSVWTMLTLDRDKHYLRGIQALGRSVRRHSSLGLDLVVMQLQGQKELDAQSLEALRQSGWRICTVQRIPPVNEQATTERFRDQFTKLHLWGMTQYRGILYLDADTLVVGPIDELFSEAYLGGMRAAGAGITAAKDIREGKWVSSFNMGVFLVVPNHNEYQRLLDLQQKDVWYEVTMAEQGFLNVVYSFQWHVLDFRFNANLAVYSEQRSFWEQQTDLRIVHYTMVKPWRCPSSSPFFFVCEWWINAERETRPTAEHRCAATAVTAYYPLHRSKHSGQEYRVWMHTGVLRLDTCLVAFVPDEETKRLLLATVPPYSPISLRVIKLDMQDFVVSQSHTEDDWAEQYRLDHEQARHSVELYKVWAEKAALVRRVIESNPFSTQFFVWVDIGSFRSGIGALSGRTWPAEQALRRLPRDRVWFGQVTDFVSDDYVLDRDGLSVNTKTPSVIGSKVSISGAIFGGTRDAILRFGSAYYSLLSKRIRLGLFSGKDQTLYQDLAVGSKPPICTVMGGWFVLQDVLGGVKPGTCSDICRSSPTWLAPLRSENNNTHQCVNADYKPTHPYAVWSFLTIERDRAYLRGALTLGRSVRRHSNVSLDLVAMQLEGPKELDAQSQAMLRQAGWQVCTVQRIAPVNEQATFPRFRDQFTKFHLWGMTQYRGILYLDADTLVVGPIDELFSEAYLGGMRAAGAGITAARDIYGGKLVDTFNMGVFLIAPDRDEYRWLRELQACDRMSFRVDLAEQGFLNVVYRHKWNFLPFRFNANLAFYSQMRPMWDQHAMHLAIVHYTMTKPWACGEEYRRICEWWLKA